jgi:hypothetical protein
MFRLNMKRYSRGTMPLKRRLVSLEACSPLRILASSSGETLPCFGIVISLATSNYLACEYST